jgi:hypothetical protein
VRSRNVALLLLLAGLIACSQFRVRARSDPNADFDRLHTFAWLPLDQVEPADQRVLDRAVDARIRQRVDADLRARGFVPADEAGPDFYLNYRVTSSPGSAMRGPRTPYGWGGWWTGWAGAEGVYSESFDVGALYLAVVDPRTRHMIWVGAAEARLLPHVSLERRLKRVDTAVYRLLEYFPPR